LLPVGLRQSAESAGFKLAQGSPLFDWGHFVWIGFLSSVL
jgi:hypothetical protein